MSGTVAQNQVSAFTSPSNGDALDAVVVKANDNATRTAHNTHDADATIHVQSSPLASRPAPGTTGRVWFTSDGLRMYYDTGSAWNEAAYLPLSGGTLTGDLSLGAHQLLATNYSLSGAGALTLNAGAAISGNTTIGGTLGVTGATTLTGGATLGGDLSLGSHQILANNYSITGAGALTLNGGASIAGNTTIGGTLRVNGVDGFAVGSIGGVQRIQYGSDGATTFSILTAADTYADWYCRNGTFTGTLAVSGGITGALTGNASTATKLATARNINGVAFDGSADVTVPAAAGTLTGSTLASGVTASSLTSVGTLTSLTASGTATLSGTLKHTGGVAGFFNVSPITQPSITGSRTGADGLALTLLGALAALGLVANNTTP